MLYFEKVLKIAFVFKALNIHADVLFEAFHREIKDSEGSCDKMYVFHLNTEQTRRTCKYLKYQIDVVEYSKKVPKGYVAD